MIRAMTRTARGINTVNLILDHASRRFLANGYRATTVEQIAKDASISKGAVYFHFKDKAALAVRLVQRADEQLQDAMADAMQGRDPQDQLIRFLHRRSLLGQERPVYWLLMLMLSVELAGSGDALDAQIQKTYRRLQNYLEELIRAGVAAGQFTSELPVPELAAIIVATHDGMLLQWSRGWKHLNAEQLLRAMRRSVLNGLGAANLTPEIPQRAIGQAVETV